MVNSPSHIILLTLDAPEGMLDDAQWTEKRERNGSRFVRATLRKSCPPTSHHAAKRFTAMKSALSGAETCVPVRRVNGEDVFILGTVRVEGRRAARLKYKEILQAILEEFFPSSVVQELIEHQKIDELELADVCLLC